MKTSQIRQAFLDYFVQQGHQLVPSSSLVPTNDPTLLFTNAGMVQFKDVFLGEDKRSYTRAVSAQRCLRAGGKHNDLDNVGYTARHHTFFEMLGNFSFGDYFKRDAIRYAWEFLTQVLQLPVERLWVTVHRDDDEAAAIWLNEIGVSSERFSRCGDADNFWSMGETGPCGPCSELFYDHGTEIPGGPPGSPDADGDRYIEIWNLVFMQYNRDTQGTLHPLPNPSVDTGMGLERIAAVIQHVHTNYDIDLFVQLIQAIAKYAGDLTERASLNVIADHLRACAFLIADGVLPGNEGRAYVLRRIIRRAIRHGHKLSMPIPFFSRLVPSLIQVMGDVYPELSLHQASIEDVLAREETQFARTLDQGLRLLQERIETLMDRRIPGEVAFKLYDTYGFPLDLTADIAREQGLELDQLGFEACMQQQRDQSQAASQFNQSLSIASICQDETQFQGYEHNKLTTELVRILVNDAAVDVLQTGLKAAIVLRDTPFYAESGGQVGDQGTIIGPGVVFRVEDTQRQGQAILHYGQLVQGELKLGQSLVAEIDAVRRDAIRLNHSATHLLHAALKSVLGPRVQQKGSLVEAERARFDFSHNQSLTQDELNQIETFVNQAIRDNLVVNTQLMSLEEAKQSGALALFGEKYSDVVRVLSMGEVSKELCGGTHVKRTGDIGLFKIESEFGVASGIRRIEMVTGAAALQSINQQITCLRDLAAILKVTPEQVVPKLQQTLAEAKQYQNELDALKNELALDRGKRLVAEFETVGDVNCLVKQMDDTDPKSLRATLDQLKSSVDSAVIVLYTITDDKLYVVAGISKSLIGCVPSATSLVKYLCGHGGGREDMAQGGGTVPVDLHERIAQIRNRMTVME